MFGIGTGELLLILVIAVLVIGPEKMVEFAGKLGRFIAKFRQQSDEITREFREALAVDEVSKQIQDLKEGIQDIQRDVLIDQAVAPKVTPSTTEPAPPQSAAEPKEESQLSPPPLPSRQRDAWPNLSPSAEPVVIEAGLPVLGEDAEAISIEPVEIVEEDSPSDETVQG